MLLDRSAGDEDSRAARRELTCDATTRTPGGSGYHGNFTVQSHVRNVPERSLDVLEKWCARARRPSSGAAEITIQIDEIFGHQVDVEPATI